MTTKKKKKAKKSSPGRSATTSPSSSTQTSGDNRQQIAQSTASSSPINCDLAAADIAGSDTIPFSDLLLEHNTTWQIENGAIDLDLTDNDEIPSTPTKEFVGITQETSINQSALPAVVVNPELQDIGAAAPSSAKSIVAVSSEITTPKSALSAVVANPESQDLGDATPSSAKPTVVVSSKTTTPKYALPAAVVNPESQVQGDTTPKTTEKGTEIDHHPLPAGKPWVVLGDFNQVLRPSENSAAVCPNVDLSTRLFADSLFQSGLHIDAWINVLRKRYDAYPQHFRSERICFLDHLFAQQWIFNFKDFTDSKPNHNGLGRRLSGGAWNYYADTIPSFCQSNKVWGTDIDDIYAPVNFADSHWIAMWIPIPKRHIVVFDCICSSISPEELDVVMESFLYMVPYLLVECASSDEVRAQYSLEPFTFERLTNIPPAKAGDCGVYTLIYIECHALGIDFSKKDFAKPNGKSMRDKMAVDIFQELPNVHEFLDELRAQYSLEPFTYERPTNIPPARAGDCGVYTLKYIECHALGIEFSKKDFAKANGKSMRDKMAVDIFQELPDAHEFENKDMDDILGTYDG
ncbi:hypothetical protein F2Q69_00040840 [Brassica cretica]|uniref:Ubiquitin-like protease family profile domain-containing protein n=1 Tax=Brassica cretica TaxID=69181 RepID=A0A8S9N3R0_BRACR|nr:hypothetical protein F2Q69_00040840 [Brassica cretica]